jgi:chemotaxis receptor (MCP) glutamine deamidase CheD
MQTERIAKLIIQLERIQNVMDAQFQKKRVQSNVVENLINELSLGPKERSLIAKMFAGNKIDADEIVIDGELEVGDQLTYLFSIKPELSQRII